MEYCMFLIVVNAFCFEDRDTRGKPSGTAGGGTVMIRGGTNDTFCVYGSDLRTDLKRQQFMSYFVRFGTSLSVLDSYTVQQHH